MRNLWFSKNFWVPFASFGFSFFKNTSLLNDLPDHSGQNSHNRFITFTFKGMVFPRIGDYFEARLLWMNRKGFENLTKLGFIKLDLLIICKHSVELR